MSTRSVCQLILFFSFFFFPFFFLYFGSYLYLPFLGMRLFLTYPRLSWHKPTAWNTSTPLSLTSPYAMSLSKSWNHFGPHQPFPEKQNPASFYRDALSSSFFSPVALSLSAAFSHPISCSAANMNTLSPDEMERFQKLSNSYQPDVQVISVECPGKRWLTACRQGPLVSNKQSSHSIALDYSNADPTLATKTNVSFRGLYLLCYHDVSRI